MKIAQIEALPGQKAFGFVKATETHGGFEVHFPLHIVAGQRPGPTLLVVAGMSGLEIEPALILPQVVAEIEPATLRGTLLVVPLFNTSGFEFEQVNAIWDDRALQRLGRGAAAGTVSEQLLHCFYEEVVARADGVIDIRTGALWGYFRYAGVYGTGAEAGGRALAEALGLPHVVLGAPADGSYAWEAAADRESGGDGVDWGWAGLRDYRQEDMQRVRQAVVNGLRQMGMLDGALEGIDGPVTTVRGHTWLKLTGPRGLTFMAKEKRGQMVSAGEVIGYVKHPFTGAIVHEFRVARSGLMVHAGASWPIVPEDAILAILGDIVT